LPGWFHVLLIIFKDSLVVINFSPKPGIPDAMMDVNYHAARAAAVACQQLQFGHWIQSSTQATNAERGGQVDFIPQFELSAQILSVVDRCCL